MTALTATLAAQITAEIKMRMRSFATPIAVLAFLAGAILWIPDPKSNTASLAWTVADGTVQSPIYSAGYLGLAVAILSCIILTLGGFYLVAGSVRRDRQRGVGAILAATPLSKTAYLGGKFAAHLAYLFVLGSLGLVAGVAAFVRYGTGPFAPVAFLMPYLLLAVPAMVTVAAFAVLFDVTPGLRSRGGLVLWFFFFAFVLVKIPLDLTGGGPENETVGVTQRPFFDPAGVASDQWLVRKSIPADARGISTGHITHGKGIARVPWKGIDVDAGFLAIRALNIGISLLPLALAILIFDRFDPARGRRRLSKPGFIDRLAAKFRRREPLLADAGPLSSTVKLTPAAARPSAIGAIFAEARLIWESASWIKWPLALSAILAGILPGNAPPGVFLILLVPVISEEAAREDLAGTRALVFSQPAVPASAVLWKTASVGLFVLMAGTPMAVRAFFVSPVRGLAAVAGLLAIAGVSVGFGSLTSGGKLFTGLYAVVWYMAVSSLPEADFTSALSKAPRPVVSLLYLALGAVLVGVAMGREKLQRA